MKVYSINNVLHSTNRNKLFILLCEKNHLHNCIKWLYSNQIPTINIGKNISSFIDKLEDFRYLNIDIYEYIKKSIDEQKVTIENSKIPVVAICNLGILFEPALELNPTFLIKDLSVSTALIIVWENEFDDKGRLNWSSQQDNIYFEFNETEIKELKYVI